MHIQCPYTSACSVAHHENLQAAELNDNPSDDIEEVSHFQGDFFSNYQERDLPWPAEAELDEAIPDDQGFVETDYDCYLSQCGNINEYAPFASQIEWDIAHWAKVHGITSTAVTELLGIKGVGFYATRYA